MKSKKMRYFFTSMGTTLCVAVFCFGVLAVDYNTRWVGFGNDAPIACVTTTQQGEKELEINAMGAEHAVDITAGYKAAKWTKKTAQQTAQWAKNAAQQTAKWVTDVYDDIRQILSQQGK